ncbi:MAG: PilZ domain-containing protein [Hyphomicrobiales bacterium]|nr:PilZ domain-containing protein [Hyphomicrobiales bacterium]
MSPRLSKSFHQRNPFMTGERRNNHRIQWHSWAMVSACDGDWSAPCILSDFSNGGAKLSGLSVRHLPDQFLLRIARGVKPRNCRVVWRAPDALGVEFTEPPSEAAESIVEERAGPKVRTVPRAKRRLEPADGGLR